LGVLTEEELLISVADARAHNETIVMTNGCFDILHFGHISYLQQAKSLGTRLIVAVNDDASVGRLKGPTRPINSLEHRLSMLAALRVVDWVVPFSEDTPERLINRVLPDLLVKGGDYQPNAIAGSRAVIANGGSVRILPFVDGHSTSSIVKKLQEEELA
jgi:D-beta-D-heptose 7-phosphate kinase/D-beta-D-heptose 1-phosphate adenosyltransferase